jgi:hypothetical protein
VTGNTLVHLSAQHVTAIRELCPPPGHQRFFHQVALLGTAVGPVHLALASLLEPPDDPWFVVSDEPTDAETLGEYGLRFDIEEAFLDEKSGDTKSRPVNSQHPKLWSGFCSLSPLPPFT